MMNVETFITTLCVLLAAMILSWSFRDVVR